MFILHFQATEVDFCEHCRGVWLDAGELEELAGTSDDPILVSLRQENGSANKQQRLCPRCDARLLEITVPTTALKLDRCPKGHGLWFDEGELRQVLEIFHQKPEAGKTIQFLDSIFGSQTNKPNKEINQ